ncbi:hypothetical protein PF011_g16529 [Phytophthora fragariae]|uniref:Replication protein A OB domain-containing protein n=1 Tax=Phytophthora fragariae TaxID=53985 RepID=A0A6A3JIL7_9STRA|nr:hypothetical protein PF011_g16529 [Phytophthora fragariae]
MTLLPIRNLSPVLGFQWEVVARIAFLSPVRQWSNANGRGHVMNAELIDAESSRICACAFHNDAKKFATILRGDGVFLFAGGRIRKAARGFGKPNHTYEIALSSSASVTPVEDDDSIEHVDCAITTIRDLAHADAHAQVDALAMIMDVGVLDSVVDRKGGVQVKRELKLVDSSNVEIVCTLWNEFAEVDYTAALHQPYAFRQVMVNDFRGRSVSTLSSTMAILNPNLPEVIALQEWFDDTRGEFSVPISLVDCKFTSLKDVATQQNGTSVSVIGVIVRIDKPVDVTAKDGRLLRKHTVALQAMSETEVECTLWQAEVEKVTPEQLGKVLSLNNAKVVIYGDYRVATSVKTLVLVDPAIHVCFELVRWYTTSPNITADADNKENTSTTTTDEEKLPTSPQQPQHATLEHSLRDPIGNVEPAILRSHSPQATPSPIAADDPGTPSKKPKKRERGSLKEGKSKRSKVSP